MLIWHNLLCFIIIILGFQIVNGIVQYRLELGSGEGVVRVASARVSDGRWHEIRLQRDGASAKLTVDGRHVAHGSAPGANGILNLYSDDLYIGAEVRQHPVILGDYLISLKN